MKKILFNTEKVLIPDMHASSIHKVFIPVLLDNASHCG